MTCHNPESRPFRIGDRLWHAPSKEWCAVQEWVSGSYPPSVWVQTDDMHHFMIPVAELERYIPVTETVGHSTLHPDSFSGEPSTHTIGEALGYGIKDSGERVKFDSGMVRDTSVGKIDYTLIMDGPMLERWAQHLTNGAKKYEKRNWMKAGGKASGVNEYNRFKESALRHLMQWFSGEDDEDHAAAVFFNINGAEYMEDLDD